MVDSTMLDNAIEIAKEEVMNPDDLTKQDVKDFKKCLYGLLDKLEEDARDEDEE